MKVSENLETELLRKIKRIVSLEVSVAMAVDSSQSSGGSP